MTSLLIKARLLIRHLPERIWFLPTIITLGFLLLSALLIRLRYTDTVQSIDSYLSFLAINAPETSRALIATITGGLISLVVFSFSMVMVVLNQATAQFSPRLLPGLVSQRQHQFILGYYLGTIIYCLSVLARIGPSGLAQKVPASAVLLAVIFGMIGLVLFIQFIHTISSSVRIDSILFDLHKRTAQSIEAMANQYRQYGEQIPIPDEAKTWPTLAAPIPGYFMGVNLQKALKYCDRKNISVQVICQRGRFVSADTPFLRISKALNGGDQKVLLSYFDIAHTESVHTDYLHGLHQLTEVAIKAMSPGINDPGTALNAIDYQSELLYKALLYQPTNCLLGENDKYKLWLPAHDVAHTLHSILTPLRTYCTGDLIVTERIIVMLNRVAKIEGMESEKRRIIRGHIRLFKSAALKQCNAEEDKRFIRRL